MAHFHAVIWIDHREARVFHFNPAEADKLVVHPHDAARHIHHGLPPQTNIDSRFAVLDRRILLLAAVILAAPPAFAQQAPSPDDPAAFLTAIYARVAKGKGDNGGTFVFNTKAAKTKYLSTSLGALWARAEAHTPKGDAGPIDFDPVTNSQDPDVKTFKVAPEKNVCLTLQL